MMTLLIQKSGKTMTFSKDYNIKIKDTFKRRIEDFLRSKLVDTVVNPDVSEYKLTIKDRLREKEEILELNLFFQKDLFKSAQIKTVDSNSELNEYDLQIYLMDLFEQIIINDYNGKTETYVIRNYYSYFNSSSFDLDIVINTKNKVRIHTVSFPSRMEPLTEQILAIDTKVEAVNLKHAQSIAYTPVLKLLQNLKVSNMVNS